jgi:carbon monoxide dehydrogenase subunit G
MSNRFKTAFSAAVIALTTTAMAMPADAEQRRNRQQSSPEVSATTSTSGSGGGGTTTLNGAADAEAINGGEVNTRVRGRTTDRRGMISATATARDEDELARSRSRTIVTPRGDVRTNTMDMYRQRGSRPVIERTRTRTPGG